MDSFHKDLCKELSKLKISRQKFNAKALEQRGYPLWIIKQQDAFLSFRILQLEKQIQELGIDISQEKLFRRKKNYRFRKPKK